MSADFNHEDLVVYQNAIRFIPWADDLCRTITAKACAVDHLGRASASIPLNIVLGNARTTPEGRCSFFDVAYGSALECAACLDVLHAKSLIRDEQVRGGKEQLVRIVSMIVGLKNASVRDGVAREERAGYGHREGESRLELNHERLQVYQQAVQFVAWCDLFSARGKLPGSATKVLDKQSTAMVLNTAEGNGRFSIKDRCRFIGYARDAAFHIAPHLDVIAVRHTGVSSEVRQGKKELARIVSMLFAWERSLVGEGGIRDNQQDWDRGLRRGEGRSCRTQTQSADDHS